ncbi:hemolysin family protein [Haloferacaceae archaeon DSL9]
MATLTLFQTTSTAVTTGLGLLTILILIGLSAFFSSSEIALFSLPRHRVDALVADGVPGSKQVRALKSNPHRLLVTILVGNNIVNIATSSIATGLLALYLTSGQSVVVATLSATTLVLLFGESAPKSYAIEHTESWAVRVARPLKLAEYLLFPLVVTFDHLTRQVNRITGGRSALEEQYITREELEEMIDAGEREGAIEDTEHELFRRLFRLRSLVATDAMTPRPTIAAIRHDASVSEAITVCLESHHSRLPVYRGTLDTVLGVVTLHDLVSSARQSDASEIQSMEALSQPILHVPESKPLDELLIEMREMRVELAVVVDEFGTTEGLVALEDITEEVVGEILERREAVPIERLDDATALVRGDVRLTVLNSALSLAFPEDEPYQTIAGFILDQIGQAPEEGETVRYGDIVLRVSRTDGPQIRQVRLTKR